MFLLLDEPFAFLCLATISLLDGRCCCCWRRAGGHHIARRPSPSFLMMCPSTFNFKSSNSEFTRNCPLLKVSTTTPTTPPRSFSKLSISLAFRCHPRFCLLGKQEIQRQSSFNAFPSKFCFILFGPSERVLRKKRNCAHHRCCCLGWCCWKGLWVINTTALRSGWKIPSLDTNTSAGLTNTMSSTFYSPSPCFVTLNVLLLLFLRLLRHIQCSSLLLDGHPSIHPSTLISTQYVQTVDTNTMKDGFQKEGIKRPIS